MPTTIAATSRRPICRTWKSCRRRTSGSLAEPAAHVRPRLRRAVADSESPATNARRPMDSGDVGGCRTAARSVAATRLHADQRARRVRRPDDRVRVRLHARPRAADVREVRVAEAWSVGHETTRHTCGARQIGLLGVGDDWRRAGAHGQAFRDDCQGLHAREPRLSRRRRLFPRRRPARVCDRSRLRRVHRAQYFGDAAADRPGFSAPPCRRGRSSSTPGAAR